MGATAFGTAAAASSGLDSRHFRLNNVWKEAPLLKGHTESKPSANIKNILITGGAGFIASWVVRHLTITYPSYNIFCFDKLDYCSSLYNVVQLYKEPNFKFIYGDVTRLADVVRCLTSHHIDTVFHFAAQSHVDLSFGNSYHFTEANVCGTHILLEAAKEARVRRFIHVSTDEVYGEIEKEADDVLEENRLAPTNPYAASKAAAEMFVNAYWKSYNLPAIIVRMNNVYGPHQYPEKVIPKFTSLLNRGEPLILQGDGSHSRKYIYAGDVADAFDTVLHKGELGQIYNVDSKDEITNLELCSRLLRIFGLPCTSKEMLAHGLVRFGQDRPFNDQRYAVNGAKLRKLGWEPKTDFETGLKLTVDWYRKFGEQWWDDITPALRPLPLMERGQAEKAEARSEDFLSAISQHSEMLSQYSSQLEKLAAQMDTRKEDSVDSEEQRGRKGTSVVNRLSRLLSCKGLIKRMDSTNAGPKKFRSTLLVLGSLLVVWSIAFLAPSQYERIQDRLPSVKLGHSHSRSLFNESKLAILIEDRPLGHLAPLLQHMISVVPPDWRFLFLGSRESLNQTFSSIATQLHQKSGKLTLREIPENGTKSIREVTNRLFTDVTFYQEYTDPAEWLLVFQADSMLCAQSELSLDDWLRYDWVGAPWAVNDRFGGSGGLSIRRVSRIKQVLQFQARLDEASVEDHWLVDRIGLLPDSEMASPEVEARFSVEGIWYDQPMGYHLGSGGLHKEVWEDPQQRRQIFEYCPEIKMIMDMRFSRERCTAEEARLKEEEAAKKEEKQRQEQEKNREKEKSEEEDHEDEEGEKEVE